MKVRDLSEQERDRLESRIKSRGIKITLELQELDWRHFEEVCNALEMSQDQRNALLRGAVFQACAGAIYAYGESSRRLLELRDLAFSNMMQRELDHRSNQNSPDPILG